MKKTSLTFALIFVVGIISSSLFAKCYTFSSGDGYKVCVSGDSFSDRKKAMKICKKAKGSDCGNISSTSSSCHSNSGKCYDPSGKAGRSLSGY